MVLAVMASMKVVGLGFHPCQSISQFECVTENAVPLAHGVERRETIDLDRDKSSRQDKGDIRQGMDHHQNIGRPRQSRNAFGPTEHADRQAC